MRALVVDLEAETALSLIARVRAEAQAGHPITVIAFGPHVETEALARAKETGADQVLTRGAFAAKLPALLTDLHEGT